jgi:hypothetical protein
MPSKSYASLLVSAILAIIGGALIIISGYRTRSFIIMALSYSDQRFSGSSPFALQLTAQTAIAILSAVMALGGILAIIGGILLLLKRITIGKILIAMGGGVGFVSIAIAIGYSVFSSGLPLALSHVEYWIGVVIASLSRWLAGRA